MHILTLNTDHLGMGRLGYAGLYTATADIPKMFEMSGVKVSEVWFGKIGDEKQVTAEPINQIEAAKLISSGKISAMYTQYIQTGFGLELAALAIPYTVPIISLCHDLVNQMDTMVAWACNPARHASDVAVTISDEGAKALNKMFKYAGINESYPDADIEVIPLGTFQPTHSYSRESARKQRGWKDDEIVFLWFGRFHETYKADLTPLLLAFSEVIKNNKVPNARLVAMGGDETGKVEQLKMVACKLGIDRFCEWLPNATKDERDQSLAGADMLVNVSDHIQEMFGLANIEAMANGLPIIASDWDGFRNIVDDGKNGILVSTNFDATILDCSNLETLVKSSSEIMGLDLQVLVDAMEKLGSDKDLRVSMAVEARKKALNKYSWKSVGASYIKLIEDRIKIAKDLPPRNSSRPWMSTVFSHFGSNLLNGKHRVGKGTIELSDVMGFVENADVRNEMENLYKRFEVGEDFFHWKTIKAGSPVSIERVSMMKLLKYGVLRVRKEMI